jgi:hypothetical protein
MKSMLLNDVNHSSVIDILHEAPVSPALNSRYIASSHSTRFWAGKDHMIATCVDSSSVIWSYKMPVSDDMVFVENRNTKYIFGAIKIPIKDSLFFAHLNKRMNSIS